jgi:predicted GNAT family acetyltransferase
VEANEVKVVNNSGESRFEANVDGHESVLEYRESNGEIVFLHTEVAPELEGRGVGSRLARAGLEHAKANGLGVVPRCSFVAKYIERHPEYGVLVRD